MCNRLLAGEPSRWYSLVGLAVANAWIGHESGAEDALAELDYPGSTVKRGCACNSWTMSG